MESGKIVNWNAAKGFGFITPVKGGRDIFLHASELAEGVTSAQITLGSQVEFDTVQADKGLKAVRVALLAPVFSVVQAVRPEARPPAQVDGPYCDVLSYEEMRAEIHRIGQKVTDALLEDFAVLAREHGWLE